MSYTYHLIFFGVYFQFRLIHPQNEFSNLILFVTIMKKTQLWKIIAISLTYNFDFYVDINKTIKKSMNFVPIFGGRRKLIVFLEIK